MDDSSRLILSLILLKGQIIHGQPFGLDHDGNSSVILVPEFWYQNFGTRIQNFGTRIQNFGPGLEAFMTHYDPAADANNH